MRRPSLRCPLNGHQLIADFIVYQRSPAVQRTILVEDFCLAVRLTRGGTVINDWTDIPPGSTGTLVF